MINSRENVEDEAVLTTYFLREGRKKGTNSEYFLKLITITAWIIAVPTSRGWRFGLLMR